MKAVRVDNLQAQLPRRPYATNDLKSGLRILSRKAALLRDYIQLNPPSMKWAMVFDLDYETWPLVAEDEGLPNPTFFVGNPENKHAHLIYALANPVCTSSAGHQAPMRYLAAVERAYRNILEADPCYAGLIAKNPWKTDRWKVVDMNNSYAYDLDYLAQPVYDMISRDISIKEYPITDIAGLGRNCFIFEAVRKWAYKAIRQHWEGDISSWRAVILTKCQELNEALPNPLYSSEVRSIAKGIAKWIWRRLSRDGFSECQRRRAERRWGPSQKPDGLMLLHNGYTASNVAKLLGVDASTVRRWRRESIS